MICFISFYVVVVVIKDENTDAVVTIFETADVEALSVFVRVSNFLH